MILEEAHDVAEAAVHLRRLASGLAMQATCFQDTLVRKGFSDLRCHVHDDCGKCGNAFFSQLRGCPQRRSVQVVESGFFSPPHKANIQAEGSEVEFMVFGFHGYVQQKRADHYSQIRTCQRSCWSHSGDCFACDGE